jgi:hypothetical protein
MDGTMARCQRAGKQARRVQHLLEMTAAWEAAARALRLAPDRNCRYESGSGFVVLRD